MKRILIATTNQGKIMEIKKGFQLFKKLKIRLLTLNDVGVEEEPEETGQTFRENSRIKAEFYGKKIGIPTIADDGGLTIPYLNNVPGVLSRRWPGYEASDEELINYCLRHLRGVTQANRTAYLTVCLCFFNPKTKKTVYAEEKVKGYIAEKPSQKRIEGYPFRVLFIVDKFNKYYNELTDEEHDKINHRLKAVKKLAKRIENLLK